MANNYRDLDQIFHALADPTRRQVVERLIQGPASVSQLADPFEMALPSFLQHIKVLEASGLVRSEKVGRVRTVQIRSEEIKRAQDWLANQLDLWERRLDQLDSYVLSLSNEEESRDKQ